MNKVLKKFFKEKKPNNIFTYEEFIEYSENKINNADLEGLDKQSKIYYDYSDLNLYRTNRINKTLKPKEEIIEQVKKIEKPQTWLIITEDWCGDSAQNLPYIVKYLKYNSLIKVIVVLRDSNLDAIDSYFTEGNPRSIPKIIVFDENANEICTWGPRPKFAQDLVRQLKAEGFTKEEFNERLHLWYGRNRGKELEKELSLMFKKVQNY